MTTTFQSVLDWALFYHREGLSVIPLKSEPASDRKRPAIEWKKYSEQRASEEQIRQWFGNDSNYNIAVVMGKVSGCMLGIDSDGPLAWQHYEAKLAAPGHENLRSTLINNTMMNKTGWFCKQCADDLVRMEIAERLEGKSPDPQGGK